jgi:hypothetical protein
MHLSTGFYWGSCYSIFSFILCMFCRLLFVLFYFFFWPLCCLSFFDTRILITPLVSFGHCVVCSSSIYGFWLPLWYLLAIVLSVLLRYMDSDYPFGIFWPLCCLFFFDIRILITSLWYLQTLFPTKVSYTYPTYHPGWTQLLAYDNQFPFLIRHPPYYS